MEETMVFVSKYDDLLKSDTLVADGTRLDGCVKVGEFEIGEAREDNAEIDDISIAGVVCGVWVTQTLVSLNNVLQENGLNIKVSAASL